MQGGARLDWTGPEDESMMRARSHMDLRLCEEDEAPRGKLVRARFPYEAAAPTQLSFDEGDVIELIGVERQGWQYGEGASSGERGWFPAAYADNGGEEGVREKNGEGSNVIECRSHNARRTVFPSNPSLPPSTHLLEVPALSSHRTHNFSVTSSLLYIPPDSKQPQQYGEERHYSEDAAGFGSSGDSEMSGSLPDGLSASSGACQGGRASLRSSDDSGISDGYGKSTKNTTSTHRYVLRYSSCVYVCASVYVYIPIVYDEKLL